MEPLHTFEHAGLTVELHCDDDPQHANPRECDGNVGRMFCDYRGYTLGDDDTEDPRGHYLPCEACDDQCEVDGKPCPKCEGAGEAEVSIVEWLKRTHDATVILPLFVYEHSGITMRAGANLLTGEDNFSRRNRFPLDGAGWDTSSVGVIYDTAETRKQMGDDASPASVAASLNEEVRYYAAYLENEVYGYIIKDEAGEELDSCWGFLDPDAWSDEKSSVRAEARSAAEYERAKLDREAVEAHRWACADVMTVPR